MHVAKAFLFRVHHSEMYTLCASEWQVLQLCWTPASTVGASQQRHGRRPAVVVVCCQRACATSMSTHVEGCCQSKLLIILHNCNCPVWFWNECAVHMQSKFVIFRDKWLIGQFVGSCAVIGTHTQQSRLPQSNRRLLGIIACGAPFDLPWPESIRARLIVCSDAMALVGWHQVTHPSWAFCSRMCCCFMSVPGRHAQDTMRLESRRSVMTHVTRLVCFGSVVAFGQSSLSLQ